MQPEQLVQQARRIIQVASQGPAPSALAEAKEFLRVYAGQRSAFYEQLTEIKQTNPYAAGYVAEVLEGFARYVENGLLHGISVQREARLDVVSDFLAQANSLLESHDVHPAAPAMLAGAALEEFLRNWVEDAGQNLGTRKSSIDSFASLLREAELVTKQDVKDITSWGGLRNHAAHGEWDLVSDRARVQLMLDGIGLFMRKYSGGA
jgi:hypothetical protein